MEFGSVIISRRVDEGVWIGNTLVQVIRAGSRCQLRITADKRVRIVRGEKADPAMRDAVQCFQVQGVFGAPHAVWVDVGQATEDHELAVRMQDSFVEGGGDPSVIRIVDALSGEVVL